MQTQKMRVRGLNIFGSRIQRVAVVLLVGFILTANALFNRYDAAADVMLYAALLCVALFITAGVINFVRQVPVPKPQTMGQQTYEWLAIIYSIIWITNRLLPEDLGIWMVPVIWIIGIWLIAIIIKQRR